MSDVNFDEDYDDDKEAVNENENVREGGDDNASETADGLSLTFINSKTINIYCMCYRYRYAI